MILMSNFYDLGVTWMGVVTPEVLEKDSYPN